MVNSQKRRKPRYVLSHHKDFAKLKEKNHGTESSKKMDVTDKIKALKTRACFLLNQQGGSTSELS
jgi:hypothetical protein